MDLYFADSPRLEAVPPGCLVVCPDDLTLLRCGELGLPATLVNKDVFVGDDRTRDSPVETACRLGQSWYRDQDGADFTVHNGISLGGVVEGVAWYVIFAEAFKFASAAARLIQEHRPAKVWAAESLPEAHKSLLEAVCRRAGASLCWLATGRTAQRPLSVARGYCHWPLTHHAGIRRLLNAALDLISRPSGTRIVASYYLTLHPLFALLGAEKGVAPVFYDWPARNLPRLPAWPNWRFLTAPSGSGLSADGAKRVASMAARFDELSIMPAYRDSFAFAGLDCWEAVRPQLKRVLTEDFPMMADAAEKLSAALDRDRPSLVVVPYDSSGPERLLLEIAKRKNIPSALVLHGVGGLPRMSIIDTHADRLIAGGPEIVGFYDEIGYPRDRVIVTGQPFLDPYVGRGRHKRPDGLIRVLLPATGLPIERNIGTVLDSLKRFDSVRTVVKLHPGEPTAVYRKVLSGRLGDRCRLESGGRMEDLLPGFDLVLASPSTALIEAMALQLPVIFLNLERFPLTPPFSKDWGLDPCESPEAVTAALGRMLPDNLPTRVDHSRALEAFAGKLDGLCARRTLDALLILARRQEAAG